ncbi:biotin/lipoyl-binding protein, partial [Loigolactobacillus coryniformis]
MKKLFRGRFWIILGVLLVLGVIGAVGLVKANNQQAAQKQQYQTYQVKRDSALLLKGKVAAKDTVAVETGVSSTGTLTAINVKNGEHVDPGTVLMTFHDDQVQSQIDEANQTVAKTELAIQNDQQAITALKKQSNQPTTEVTGSDTDSSVADSGAAADQLQQARNTLAADQLTLQQTNDSLTRLQAKLDPQVTAKIAGTIALDTTNNSNTGIPDMQIISDGQIIDGQVTEYDYAKLKLELAVTVMPVSNTDHYQGKIVTIDQTPQAATPTTSTAQTGGSEAATYQFTVKIDHKLTNGFNVQIR